jgi:hypothetical protein
MNKNKRNSGASKSTVKVKENRTRTSLLVMSTIKKKKKIDNDIKKPLSAYNYFTIDVHKEIKEKKLEVEDRMKYIGKKWKELTEEDKKKYDEMAKLDKNRYENEIKGENNRSETKKKEVAKEDTKKGKSNKNKETEDSD